MKTGIDDVGIQRSTLNDLYYDLEDLQFYLWVVRHTPI